MPHLRSGALALLISVAMSGTALAQVVVTGDGNFIPNYEKITENSLSGTTSIPQATIDQLQEDIDDIVRDGSLSKTEKEQQIQDKINAVLPTQNGGGAGCAEQLDDLSLGLDVASTAVDLTGTIVEAVGAIVGTFGAEIPGIVLQSVGVGLGIGQNAITGVQNNLPNCNAEFTGTIEGHANLAVKQGISAFDDAITIGRPDGKSYYQGITLGGGSLAGAGTGGAQAFTGSGSDVAIGNGASAKGTNATALGTNANADGEGATALGAESDAVGRGASAVGYHAYAKGDGASALGYFSEAEGEDATALGSGSDAWGANTTALGSDSAAIGTNASALGTRSYAKGSGAVAIGSNANASGPGTNNGADPDAINATAVGTNSNAEKQGATALGYSSSAAGENSVALGAGATTFATATNAVAVGDATASEFRSLAIGMNSSASASGAAAYGSTTSGTTTASGIDSLAIQGGAASGDASFSAGVGSSATGANALAVGTGATAVEGATALGNNAQANGVNSIAIGNGAIAMGSIATGDTAFAQLGGAAYGDFSRAEGVQSAALGYNSRAAGAYSSTLGPNTTANGNGSVAIGADSSGVGATANLSNQFMFGTANHTYTAPGIGSLQSKSRQIGQVNVVTNDQFGNLADDGGEIFRRLDEHDAGIAMSMAMENPSLGPGEKFGFATAWGTFAGAHALTASMMGVVGEDVFTDGDRFAVFGGFGAGFEHGRGDDVFGGRAGFQWTY